MADQMMDCPDFSRLAPRLGARILVIGGCGGIGHCFIRHAESLGLDVTVMDLPAAVARRGATPDGGFIPIDLRDETSVESAFASLADAAYRCDGLVIASGYTRGDDRIAELDTARFDDVLSGNLRGPVLALRSASRVLSRQAAVVVLTTAMGQLGIPGYAAYGAAKSGLNAIIRILAAEMAPGVRVNGVAPGAIDNAFIRGGFAHGAAEAGPPARFDENDYLEKIPMRRMAVNEDVVGPMLFLLSDAARYITGQVLHVNGGGFMRD
jgi:3-oxoacyl-[acyl-carrier protein] reductase